MGNKYNGINTTANEEQYQAKVREDIADILNDYDIDIERIDSVIGPTYTLHEVIPSKGGSFIEIRQHRDEIESILSQYNARVIVPIPGKGTIGIEVPNKYPQTILLKPLIESKEFKGCNLELPVVIGMNCNNEVVVADLAEMPHLLIGGATGQGNTVLLNSIIISLLRKKSPEELKFLLIDPKRVEFSQYHDIQDNYMVHFSDNDDIIITGTDKIQDILIDLSYELDNRNRLLSETHSNSIQEYNSKVANRILKTEDGYNHIPYIVTIIDEIADPMLTFGEYFNALLCSIAQKGKALGIHLIIATQRPSKNVITNWIKANFPARIVFKVMGSIDSKTIIGKNGAEHLIGRGDMLFFNGDSIERLQCPYVDSDEIKSIVATISDQREPANEYSELQKALEDDRSKSMDKMRNRQAFLSEIVKGYSNLEDFAREKSEFFEMMGVEVDKGEKAVSLYFSLHYNDYEQYFVVATKDGRLAVSHVVWWQNEVCANEILNIFTGETYHDDNAIYTTY